jgi:hypothetical protein
MKKVMRNSRELKVKLGDEMHTVLVYQDESDEWVMKYKLPKCGRSHYYSLLNMFSLCFDEQYPEWADLFWRQSRGLQFSVPPK